MKKLHEINFSIQKKTEDEKVIWIDDYNRAVQV